MYIWNTKALAIELKHGLLTEHERMKYWLVTAVLMTAAMEVGMFVGLKAHPVEFLRAVLAVVITGAGVYIAYQANRAGDNRDFVGRSICLGLPLLVQLFALAIVVSIALVILLGKDEWHPAVDLLLELGLTVFFYWRLARLLRWIAAGDGVSSAAGAPPPLPAGA